MNSFNLTKKHIKMKQQIRCDFGIMAKQAYPEKNGCKKAIITSNQICGKLI